jgi:hypothetical protein
LIAGIYFSAILIIQAIILDIALKSKACYGEIRCEISPNRGAWAPLPDVMDTVYCSLVFIKHKFNCKLPLAKVS